MDWYDDACLEVEGEPWALSLRKVRLFAGVQARYPQVTDVDDFVELVGQQMEAEADDAKRRERNWRRNQRKKRERRRPR